MEKWQEGGGFHWLSFLFLFVLFSPFLLLFIFFCFIFGLEKATGRKASSCHTCSQFHPRLSIILLLPIIPQDII